MKTLYLLRHAKTEPHQARADHSRHLVEQGITACGLIADFMQGHQLRPQLILSSDAARTRETTHYLLKSWGTEIPVRFTRKLYHASAGDMLAQVQQVENSINALLMVGHNPGMHQLCLSLARMANAEAANTIQVKFPTASFLAVTFVTDDWQHVGACPVRVEHFVTPEMLQVEE